MATITSAYRTGLNVLWENKQLLQAITNIYGGKEIMGHPATNFKTTQELDRDRDVLWPSGRAW
jgi:hypothetical protein